MVRKHRPLLKKIFKETGFLALVMVWRGAVLQETDSNDKAEKMTEDMILTARQAEY